VTGKANLFRRCGENKCSQVTPGDQEDSSEGVRLVNVKFKEAKIAEKLADTSVSFGSCFDMAEKGTTGHQQGWVWHIDYG
jgi:hypothetical protein